MYYTSYFGKLSKIKENKKNYNNLLICSISHNKPDFLKHDMDVMDWGFLGPTKSLLRDYKNGLIDEPQYVERYRLYLEKLWPSICFVFGANYNRDVVLLCYEKPENFCHRKVLATFLNNHGFSCSELDI